MTDLLHRLAARAQGDGIGLRPRTGSRFEPRAHRWTVEPLAAFEERPAVERPARPRGAFAEPHGAREEGADDAPAAAPRAARGPDVPSAPVAEPAARANRVDLRAQPVAPPVEPSSLSHAPEASAPHAQQAAPGEPRGSPAVLLAHPETTAPEPRRERVAAPTRVGVRPAPSTPRGPSAIASAPRLAARPSAQPRRAVRGEPESEPAVRVTIGRIDVRAAPAPAAAAPSARREPPAIDLAEYLGRAGGTAS